MPPAPIEISGSLVPLGKMSCVRVKLVGGGTALTLDDGATAKNKMVKSVVMMFWKISGFIDGLFRFAVDCCGEVVRHSPNDSGGFHILRRSLIVSKLNRIELDDR